jgi:putative component of membrane protein insertase Oxa1/YidC/SpoIIIJ protein YidD
VVSSDNRTFRVAVCFTQYVAAMTQCTNDGIMAVTYVVHTMVSLYHRMVVEATRNNPCDFTIPCSHFTQQYIACAVAGSIFSVLSMTRQSRLHIAL